MFKEYGEIQYLQIKCIYFLAFLSILTSLFKKINIIFDHLLFVQ